jgi:hypothetical protein
LLWNTPGPQTFLVFQAGVFGWIVVRVLAARKGVSTRVFVFAVALWFIGTAVGFAAAALTGAMIINHAAIAFTACFTTSVFVGYMCWKVE